MKKIKKAFSLIEIMISAIILSIAVFWVFKLIWENQKLINNSNSYKTATSLFIPFNECIDNIFWNNKTTWVDFYLDLNNCSTWTIETWITIDNIEYYLNWKTVDINSNPIIFELQIEVNDLKLKQEYKISNN